MVCGAWFFSNVPSSYLNRVYKLCNFRMRGKDYSPLSPCSVEVSEFVINI